MTSEKKWTQLKLDTHKKYRDNVKWGTRGLSGKDPVKRVALKKLHSNHINAILLTQAHISEDLRSIFQDELNYRDNYETD